MNKGFHESFKVCDEVSIRPGVIPNEKCLIGTITGLADAPEMYHVENDYHKLIIGNGHLKLNNEKTLMEVE